MFKNIILIIWLKILILMLIDDIQPRILKLLFIDEMVFVLNNHYVFLGIFHRFLITIYSIDILASTDSC